MIKVLDTYENHIIVKIPKSYLQILKKLDRITKKWKITWELPDSNIIDHWAFVKELKNKGLPNQFISNFIKSYE